MDQRVEVDVKVNDLVIKFANTNGSGSASANTMFAKTLFRMGIPVVARNIFPSNIEGLPTWYEVRVNENGYLGRREGIDVMVAMNAETYQQDMAEVNPGGYFVHDNSKPLHPRMVRDDVNLIGVPLSRLVQSRFTDPKQRQLFKNITYIGALSALLDMEFDVLTGAVSMQYAGKDHLIQPNIDALALGRQYVVDYLDYPLPFRVAHRELNGDKIMVQGNEATALGMLYGGATVAAWYPITPSTSVAEAFEKHCAKLRRDPDTGNQRVAIVQAEDELSAIGMVIGAGWNGARSFTATSGPGVSLMQEFLGLAYFAEIPAVVVDVQRSGPSTGMPTRTQQSDLLSAAYAFHGDTKHPMLLPSTPKECFDFAADALDLAERLQTPVFVMTDLELGMNDYMSDPFEWDESRAFDRGKILGAEELESMERFGRYLDVDGDGIGYRTRPGTHPELGAFFTRGTSRDEYAAYTEDPQAYVENMDRLTLKWQTAAGLVPKPDVTPAERQTPYGILYFGTSAHPIPEALDALAQDDIHLDRLRLRAFPFTTEVQEFIDNHEYVFVVEQNRDGQMRMLLINELEPSPAKLVPIKYYGGLSISADYIAREVSAWFARTNTARISEVPQR